MELTDAKLKEYMNRLLLSRLRILCNNGFYGLLLMHMKYSIDINCETAATDGMRIYFGPEFLESLSDSELDFVMMHEIMHVVLQHCLRRGDRDNLKFNIACDVVVNSNILYSENMNLNSITLKEYGVSMHLCPDGSEGYLHTAEEVFDMMFGSGTNKKSSPNGVPSLGNGTGSRADKDNSGMSNGNTSGSWDDHSKWGSLSNSEDLKDVWARRFEEACETMSVRDPSNARGTLPLFAQRILEDLKKHQTDWRTVLNEFIQEEITDYSFAPPDRRFDDSLFFLPDFNDKDELIDDILFMVDTSGSMSNSEIKAVYSEIKGAIDQFDGKLKGWLGFFDAAVIEPKRFEDEDEFKLIRAAGGGGTSFEVIFDYVRQHMQNKLPLCIIILTDGYAPFPSESKTMGIPVLWVLTNDKANPPWGKITRLKL